MFSNVKFPTVKLVSVSDESYTVLASDVMLVVTNGAKEVRIPNATGSQRWLCVNNRDIVSGITVKFASEGGTINGSATITLSQYHSVQLVDVGASLWTKI